MPDSTPRHPIRVVAQRTGLTPATLRAWERRYDVVIPERSEGGQRLYSDQDVARLVRLRELTEIGRPISMVAALRDDDAIALLEEDRSSRAVVTPVMVGAARESVDELVERAYRLTMAFDSEGLEGTLRRAAVTLGAHAFLDQMVASLLGRFGSGWLAGEVSPAQEHLGSAVLERVLTWLTDPASAGTEGPTLVVATLPGERHGLGARLVATAAVLEGWSVTYLGVDLPAGDIASAAEEVGASAVALSIVSRESLDETLRSLVVLRELLDSGIDILVGGRAAALLGPARTPPGVEVLPGLDALRKTLAAKS